MASSKGRSSKRPGRAGGPARPARAAAPSSPATRTGWIERSLARWRAHPWRRAAIVVAVVVLVALVLDGSRLWFGIDRVAVTFPGSAPGEVTYLLVGSDSRSSVGASERVALGDTDPAGAHADVVALVRVAADGRARVLVVPRDVVVEFPGTGPHRLTIALTDGPQHLVDVVCHGLGVGVDHVVVADFDAFRRVIDEVGGVDVRFDAPVRDEASGLHVAEAGTRTLDGDDALALVRSRRPEEWRDGSWQPVAEGSAERARRDRDVLLALGPKVEARSSSLWGVHQLAGAVAGAVTVDAGLGRADVERLAAGLRRAAADQDADPASGAVGTLPVDLRDGPAPIAFLTDESRRVLTDAGAATTPACPDIRGPAASPTPPR